MKSLVAVAALIAALLFATPQRTEAEVNINIGIVPPLPQVVISAPPAMIVIPGTYIYAIPDIDADMAFYQGFWYRSHKNYWYRADHYNGPWINIHIDLVPGSVRGLPPGFRRVPPGHQKIPYGQVKKNWRSWEEGHHWGPPAHGIKKQKHKGKGK